MSKKKSRQQPSLLPAPDILFDLYERLSAERRWYTIYLLATTDDEPLSAKYIAKQITAQQKNTLPERVDNEAYKNRYISLYQTHLPSLAKIGVIEYDHDRKQVQKGPRFLLAVLILRISLTTYQTLTFSPR
jgi:predicted transcriptional regulator